MWRARGLPVCVIIKLKFLRSNVKTAPNKAHLCLKLGCQTSIESNKTVCRQERLKGGGHHEGWPSTGHHAMVMSCQCWRYRYLQMHVLFQQWAMTACVRFGRATTHVPSSSSPCEIRIFLTYVHALRIFCSDFLAGRGSSAAGRTRKRVYFVNFCPTSS